MKRINAFAGGLGTGAAVMSLAAGIAWLWRPGLFASLLSGETRQARIRRNLERAARRARLCPGYLDTCRAAGL
jgi:hypothetical protein